jgi:predicted nucleotidyltransferase
MNWVERFHRWSIELAVFLLLCLPLSLFFSTATVIVAAILITHTLNTVINGHLFAMFAHDLFWFSLYKERSNFMKYIENIRTRMERKDPRYATGVVFFGSLARGVFRDTSDLDIRFIAADGFWNAFRTAHLVFTERFLAMLSGFPIDAYMFRTGTEIRRKMDVIHEHPVVLYRHGEKLGKILPECTSFDDFKTVFTRDRQVVDE